MRLLIDTLVALMLAAVLAGVIFLDRQTDEEGASLERTRDALVAIQQQITLQAAIGEVDLSDKGYPRTVDPDWFKMGLPHNHLATSEHPWLEIAGPRDWERTHPLERTLVDDETAAFWYNPYQGVVRARVPRGLSDERTLALYNQVNASNIDALHTEIETD